MKYIKKSTRKILGFFVMLGTLYSISEYCDVFKQLEFWVLTKI